MQMQVSHRLVDLERTRANLAREIAFLKKLPPTLVIVSIIETPALWQVVVQAQLDVALALLPASNAMMRKQDDMWVAGIETAPLDWTQPVLAVSESSAGVRWYHHLADGTLLLVTAKGTRLPEVPGYIRQKSLRETVLKRKLRELPSLRHDPSVADEDTWNIFFNSEEKYTARQRQFAQAFRAVSNRNVLLTPDMLPRHNRENDVMAVNGEQLVVCRTGGISPEEIAQDSPLHGLSRIGQFWASFTPDQADRLLEFANAQRKDLPAVCEQAFKEQFEQVKEALIQFQQQYLTSTPANAPKAGPLEYWVKRQTGRHVSIMVGPEPDRRRRGFLDLRVHLWWHRSEELTLDWPKGFLDPKGFDFDNPPFYEYEHNPGHF